MAYLETRDRILRVHGRGIMLEYCGFSYPCGYSELGCSKVNWAREMLPAMAQAVWLEPYPPRLLRHHRRIADIKWA